MEIFILINDITRHAGTERAVCNLANILIKKHTVTIISRDTNAGNAFFPIDSKIQLIHLGADICHASTLQKLKKYFCMYKKLRELAKENASAVFIATISSVNALITLLGKNIKTIGCEHFNYDAACLRQKVLRRIFYPRLDFVVCLTNEDAKRYTFIKNNRLFVIPNSLSFECDITSNCTAKRIIAVGRLTKQKGFDLLLDSAVLMKERIPDWHLDIFGDGEDKDALLEKIVRLKLQTFVSIKSPTKNIELEYIASSLFVMSSRWEGLPMVLLEAQHCGIPAVSFDCQTGPSEVIVHGETGFIVPLGDVTALAEKTIELALNEEMRISFGKKAKENSKRFSTEDIEKKWDELLN